MSARAKRHGKKQAPRQAPAKQVSKKARTHAAGPRSLRWIPNALTTIRLILLMPFVLLIVDGRFFAAAIIYGIALVTDLDGTIARRWGWTSKFGTIYDPTVDALFLVAGSVLLISAGRLAIVPLAFYLVSALFRLVPSVVHLRRTRSVQSTIASKAIAFCGYGAIVIACLGAPLWSTTLALLVGTILNVWITMRWMRRGHFVLHHTK